MFKAPFSFSGRIRRTEYGLSILIIYVAFFLLSLIGFVTGSLNPWFILVLCVPIYWFAFAQGTKRCHDRGNSGWFQLIPFYGLVLLFGDSEAGINEYGPNPKGTGNQTNNSSDNHGSITNTKSNNARFLIPLAIIVFIGILIIKIAIAQNQMHEYIKSKELYEIDKYSSQNKIMNNVIDNEEAVIQAMNEFVNSEPNNVQNKEQQITRPINKEQQITRPINKAENCPTIYSIQILATAKPIPADSKNFKGLKYKIEQWFDASHPKYKYKYGVGKECSLAKARKLQKQIKKSGFPGAFIVKRENTNN